MDESPFFNTLLNVIGEHLFPVLFAVAVLAGGWLASLAVRALVLRLLGMIRLNERFQSSTGSSIDIERPIAITAFLLVLLFVIVMAFDILDIQSAASPFANILDKIIGYLPQLAGGIVLIIIAWLAAMLVRSLTNKILAATSLDETLSSEAGVSSISQSIGNLLFWLVILLFLPVIIDAFKLEGMLDPAQTMVNNLLAMVSKIFVAAVIGVVGWFVAKVLQTITVNLLNAVNIDKLSASAGIDKSVQLAPLAGKVVFIFVFIPALIAALDALKIKAISDPASKMLEQFMGAIPNVLVAIIILTIAWYVAKFVSGLIDQLLSNAGFNTLPEKTGLANVIGETQTASLLVANIFRFFAMLFATVEAANIIGFSQVRDVVTMFIEFGGNILLGSVILGIGCWLANIAHTAIERTGGKTTIVADIARFAILGLVFAMGLRAMGIADDIVNLAFGLILGALAVAFALAFGLGGREAAGKQLEHWFSRLRGDDKGKGK